MLLFAFLAIHGEDLCENVTTPHTSAYFLILDYSCLKFVKSKNLDQHEKLYTDVFFSCIIGLKPIDGISALRIFLISFSRLT